MTATTGAPGFDHVQADDAPIEEVVPGKVWITHLRRGDGVTAAIYTFAPGAEVGEDLHSRTEIGYVLDGELRDEHGTYPCGSFFTARPGSVHHPRSERGAKLLIVETDQFP